MMVGQSTPMYAIRHGQRRLFWMKVGLLLFFAVVAGRLVYIQVLVAPHYREVARRQYEVRERLPAARGNIYDRNGRALVSNAMGRSFGADRKMIAEDAGEVASRFARTFHRSREWYLDKLAAKERGFVWLERRVRPQYSKSIQAAACRKYGCSPARSRTCPISCSENCVPVSLSERDIMSWQSAGENKRRLMFAKILKNGEDFTASLWHSSTSSSRLDVTRAT